MRIPQDIIDRVVQETNLVELVSETVALRKAGAHYKGLCPFHGEKTPSFVVSPAKGIFHCFGCGEGGTALQFVMKTKRYEFREAVESLARKLGITIPQNQNNDPLQEKKQRFYKINHYAQWFYTHNLGQHKLAQDYLASRGISPETQQKFQLGYAENSFQSLIQFLKSKKVPLEEALEMGLIKESPKQKGQYYDFYRDRLIFPIQGPQGKIIGFGGRILKSDDTQAKYINSAESVIYHKSEELYGFYENKSQILAHNTVIIVEGYTDVLACAQLGLDYAVAPLGTSLTTQHIQKLKRYNLDVVLMFDGDQAGIKASIKSVDLCLEQGIHPRVVVLPEGQDPGDYLQKGRGQELSSWIHNAPFALDWLILEAYKRSGSSASGQSQAIQKLEARLAKLPDFVSKEPYRQKMSQYFGISIESANKVIEKPLRFAMPAQPRKDRLTLEEILTLFYFQKPESLKNVDIEKLSLSFEKIVLKELIKVSANYLKKHETFVAPSTISQWPTELQKEYARLMSHESAYVDVEPQECLKLYLQSFKKKRLKELTTAIAEAELKNDTERKMQLLNEKKKMMEDVG